MTDARQRLAALRQAHAGKPTLPPAIQSKAPPEPFKSLSEPAPAPAPARPSREDAQQHRDQVNAAHGQYILHHWQCRVCIAAGQHRGDRCDIGRALWEAYSEMADRH